jgi:hypothetical protein
VLAFHIDLQPAHALAQRTRDEMSLHQSSISRSRRAGPLADPVQNRAPVSQLGSSLS